MSFPTCLKRTIFWKWKFRNESYTCYVGISRWQWGIIILRVWISRFCFTVPKLCIWKVQSWKLFVSQIKFALPLVDSVQARPPWSFMTGKWRCLWPSEELQTLEAAGAGPELKPEMQVSRVPIPAIARLAECPWASHLTSLALSSLTAKVRLLMFSSLMGWWVH